MRSPNARMRVAADQPSSSFFASVRAIPGVTLLLIILPVLVIVLLGEAGGF